MSRDILLQHLAALLTVGDIKPNVRLLPGAARMLFQRLLRTLCVTMIMDADNKNHRRQLVGDGTPDTLCWHRSLIRERLMVSLLIKSVVNSSGGLEGVDY